MPNFPKWIRRHFAEWRFWNDLRFSLGGGLGVAVGSGGTGGGPCFGGLGVVVVFAGFAGAAGLVFGGGGGGGVGGVGGGGGRDARQYSLA